MRIPIHLLLVFGLLTLGAPEMSAQYAIFGNVSLENNTPFEGGNMLLSGDVQLSQITDASGNYIFLGMDGGLNYTLTPQYSGTPTECVTVQDLILITEHILGIQALSTPYKIIAADINGSGTVTTFDLILIRRVIQGIEADFPNNISWRFVDASYVFPNPLNPFMEPFPEVISIPNLSEHTQVDFVAVKMGNVNDCQNLLPATTTLAIAAVDACPGDVISVPVMVTGFNDIKGIQFSMDYDPALLSLNQTENFNLLGLGTFSFNTNTPGIISMVWNESGSTATSLPDGTAMFNLNFTVLNTTVMPGTIGFAQSPTPAEIVDANNVAYDINMVDGNIETFCGTSNPCPDGLNLYFQDDFSGFDTGTTFTIDVKADSLINVLGLQFTISWDPAVMSFISVHSLDFPDLVPEYFGVTQVGQGHLTMAWTSSSTGVTMPDGSTLFKIDFSLLANTPFFDLNITNEITPLFAYDGDGLEMPVTACGLYSFMSPCQQQIMDLDNIAYNQNLYQAIDQVNSTATITSGEQVNYNAGTAITLNPGFDCQEGGELLIEIDTCGN